MFADDEPTQLLALLSRRRTRSCSSFARRWRRWPFGSYEVGVIQRTPVPDLTPADEAALASLARRAWSLKRSLDTRTETSHAFVLPALLQMQGRTLAARSAAWTEHVQAVEAELAAIQAEIDERCFALYGIDEEDRRAITEGFGGSSPDAEAAEDGADADAEDEAEAEAAADTATLAAELVSWAVGRRVRPLRRPPRHRCPRAARPSPSRSIRCRSARPRCSPATTACRSLVRPPAIRSRSPRTGSSSTTRATRATSPRPSAPCSTRSSAPRPTRSGRRRQPSSTPRATTCAPGSRGTSSATTSRATPRAAARRRSSGSSDLRQRDTAPGATPTGSPATACSPSPDDVVAPKLALEERSQTSLVQEAGPNPTAKQRAEIAAQDAVVAELRVFADEVRRVAPLWNPDLDDGIVLVEAPLWRLVPHKPWQKELKSRWDDLAAGKYDWAHLAMHLWPERVVPKCATDRSLAIAHGLEDVFWAEGADGKWTKRARPTRPVEELVAERTSPAVKAALADLLAAPAPAAGGRGRGRKGE